MKATQQLHDLGQSIWLDNITRGLLDSGTLKHAIEEWSVTGLTSNPNAFGHAIKNSNAYNAAILRKLEEDILGEELFFELALEDLRYAADLFRSIYDQTDGVDGYVSLEVSPIVTHDTTSTFNAAVDLYARVQRPNFFIKIPGTKECLPAVEEAIFAGVPVNVTLLFSCEHYLAAAEAFLRGIERRIDVGLRPNIGSVASMSVSRWDTAVAGKVPEALSNKLGIAVARRIYKACCELLSSPRWQRVYNSGARPQRLLWVGTETRDSTFPDDFYMKALAAPFTVTTTSESTLKALADHGEIGFLMPTDGGNCEDVLSRFAQSGIDINALSAELQDQDTDSSVRNWIESVSMVASKSAALWQGAQK